MNYVCILLLITVLRWVQTLTSATGTFYNVLGSGKKKCFSSRSRCNDDDRIHVRTEKSIIKRSNYSSIISRINNLYCERCRKTTSRF